MKKLLKRLASLAMAAVMMVGVGAAAMAVDTGTYTAKTTLYKDQACTETSMGNSGIESVTVEYKTDSTATITLVSTPVFYNNEKGQLDSFALFDASGKKYTADKNNRTYTITGFPADQFQAGSVLQGEFTSYVSIMGTRTGYLKVSSLTLVEDE